MKTKVHHVEGAKRVTQRNRDTTRSASQNNDGNVHEINVGLKTIRISALLADSLELSSLWLTSSLCCSWTSFSLSTVVVESFWDLAANNIADEGPNDTVCSGAAIPSGSISCDSLDSIWLSLSVEWRSEDKGEGPKRAKAASRSCQNKNIKTHMKKKSSIEMSQYTRGNNMSEPEWRCGIHKLWINLPSYLDECMRLTFGLTLLKSRTFRFGSRWMRYNL